METISRNQRNFVRSAQGKSIIFVGMTKHIFGQRPENRQKTVDITTINQTGTENIQRYTEKMNDYTEKARKTPENGLKYAIEYIRYGKRIIQKYMALKSDENGKSNRQIRK